MTDAIQNDQLRITVEMGDDFNPSEELAAALADLQRVLAGGDHEVEGFTQGVFPSRSFTFDTVTTDYVDKSSTYFKVEINGLSADYKAGTFGMLKW